MQNNVLEYLENTSKKYPNKISFADDQNAITFLELKLFAKKLAKEIIKKHKGINKPIAVLVDRNVESIIAFMAVLYSGNYYVPIDCKMPIARIDNVLSQVDTKLVIGKEKDLDNLTQCSFKVNEQISFDVTEFKANFVNITELENELQDDQEIKDRLQKVLNVDPVYIIFTSGSTGNPKGIVIAHKNVIDFTDWMQNTFNFTSDDIFGNQAPFYFDLSVKDIYSTLKNGTTTYIIPQKVLMFPSVLFDYLNEKKVTSLIWSTSAFNLVSISGVLAKKKIETLKKVILGGEALLAKHLNNWKSSMPSVQYVNLYGPTEVTVDCTYYIIDKAFDDNDAIPIGRACENKEIILLDENHEVITEKNIPGEICVRGTGIANGYFNNFEKTSSVFIQNPRNKVYPELIYCTGDIAFYNEDNLLVFASRKDGQIKHMGYRIEIGEIERAINSFEKISEAFCFFDEDKDKIICAYSGEATDKEIIEHIQKYIPKYMFPNFFVKYEALPHNANGKIDRPRVKKEYLK